MATHFLFPVYYLSLNENCKRKNWYFPPKCNPKFQNRIEGRHNSMSVHWQCIIIPSRHIVENKLISILDQEGIVPFPAGASPNKKTLWLCSAVARIFSGVGVTGRKWHNAFLIKNRYEFIFDDVLARCDYTLPMYRHRVVYPFYPVLKFWIAFRRKVSVLSLAIFIQ